MHDGVITAVGDLGKSPDLRCSDHQLVFPGFTDVHVHLRGGDEHKEDYDTAVRAALQGGITGMLDMPNNPVPPMTREALAPKQQAVHGRPVDIGFYVGVGPGSRPSGHTHYKGFMGPSTGNLVFHDDAELEETLQHYTGQRITLHCEDPELLRQWSGRATHEEQRHEGAEQAAIETALRLARKYRLRLHVAHLSQPASLPLLEAAARESWPDAAGLPGVIWEATPHHLFFDWDNRPQHARGEFLKMNPPLRSAASRRGLLQAFLAGRIPFLSTDHAPHTVEEKSTSRPSGVPLLDTHGAFVCWLLQQGMSPTRIARHACDLPGRYAGFGAGRLRPGLRAHLAVLDPTAPWTVRAEELHTKCGWSPFEGVTLPGRVVYTVASGRLFRNGLEVT